MKAKDTRTPAQCASLEQLIRDYKRKYPGITVLGHRDWPNVHKDCPSFDVRSWMKDAHSSPWWRRSSALRC
jgi:N-acetylmuramoyl-L-alanine amidase